MHALLVSETAAQNKDHTVNMHQQWRQLTDQRPLLEQVLPEQTASVLDLLQHCVQHCMHAGPGWEYSCSAATGRCEVGVSSNGSISASSQ